MDGVRHRPSALSDLYRTKHSARVIFAILFSYFIYPLVGAIERLMPRRVPRSLVISISFAVAIAAQSLYR